LTPLSARLAQMDSFHFINERHHPWFLVLSSLPLHGLFAWQFSSNTRNLEFSFAALPRAASVFFSSSRHGPTP
jgi:hypothetical protein